MESDAHSEAITRLRHKLGNLSRRELRALSIFCSGLAGLADPPARARFSQSQEYWLLLNTVQRSLVLGREAEPVLAEARIVIEAALDSRDRR